MEEGIIMKSKYNLLLLFISIIIVILIIYKVYYPTIQGELQTDLDAVYLAYTEPVYNYDRSIVYFSPYDIPSQPGIKINLGNGNGSNYIYPEFKVTYQIHSKFDQLAGKMVLLENQNLDNRLVNVEIIADKSTTLYREEWDIMNQPILELNIPLDKARTVEIYLKTKETYGGEVLNIGLLEFAVSKDNAKPSLDAKPPKKETASIPLPSLLRLPDKVNHLEDEKYFKLRDVKHSKKYVNLVNSHEIYATDFHGDMSFNLFNGNSNDPLFLNPENIKIEGATCEVIQNGTNEFTLSNITPNEKNIRIYIPKDTIISRDGYKLKNDFVIKNVTLVSSRWEGLRKGIEPYLFTIIIIGGLVILSTIISILTHGRSGDALPIDACVLNITICILLSFVVFGLLGMLSNSFLRGGYDNDIKLMMFMGMFVIPCGTVIVYRLLMTWRYNLKALGILLGTIAFVIEILLTVSGVYLIGMLFGGVLFGSIAGVKEIMDNA